MPEHDSSSFRSALLRLLFESLHIDPDATPAIRAQQGSLELIAQTKNSEVYRRRHPLLERPEIVKVMRGRTINSTEVMKATAEEARLMAQCDGHPGIGDIFGFELDEEKNDLLIVSRYYDSPTLQQLVEECGPISVKKAAQIAIKICDALEFVHKKEILHRDVKPSNIIYQEATEQPILIDFGLAIRSSNQIVGPEEGTFNFMAPEQFVGNSLDESTDLYCLGATIYWMVSGKSPFKHADDLSKRELVSLESVLKPSPPAKFLKLIRKMMANDKSERFRSATECRDKWSEFLSDIKQQLNVRGTPQIINRNWQLDDTVQDGDELQIGVVGSGQGYLYLYQSIGSEVVRLFPRKGDALVQLCLTNTPLILPENLEGQSRIYTLRRGPNKKITLILIFSSMPIPELENISGKADGKRIHNESHQQGLIEMYFNPPKNDLQFEPLSQLLNIVQQASSNGTQVETSKTQLWYEDS